MPGLTEEIWEEIQRNVDASLEQWDAKLADMRQDVKNQIDSARQDAILSAIKGLSTRLSAIEAKLSEDDEDADTADQIHRSGRKTNEQE